MRLRFAIFLFVLLLSPLSVLAQQNAPFQVISAGSVVTGTISETQNAQMWVFAGEQGMVVNINMQTTEGDLAPYLILLDSRGRLYGGETELITSEASGILDYSLPYDGNYTIVVTRQDGANGTTTGAYRLSLELHNVLLVYGDSTTGDFTGADRRYAFEGRAGDVVTISVKREQGQFNPALSLLDANQVTLASNTRFNGSADARIVDFTLPADGRYEILITADRETVGLYTLHLFDRDTALSVAGQNPLEPLPDFSRSALAMTLSWQGTADFDLYVTGPDGVTLDYNTLENTSGGVFAGDANGGCRESLPQPSETAFWRLSAPQGDYQFEVAYVLPCGEAPGEVPFTITITQNGEVLDTIEGVLNQGGYISYDWSLE